MNRNRDAGGDGDDDGEVGKISRALAGLWGDWTESRGGSRSSPPLPTIDQKNGTHGKKDGGGDARKCEKREEQQGRYECMHRPRYRVRDDPVRSIKGKSTALATFCWPAATEPRLGSNYDSGFPAVRANGGFIHSKVRKRRLSPCFPANSETVVGKWRWHVDA